MTAEQFVALDTLRASDRRAATALDALGVADREEELSDWLVGHDVDRDWVHRPAVRGGRRRCRPVERAAAAARAPALQAGLEWVGELADRGSLLGEIREATHRVSELVAAVRSYSQLDRALVQQTDVTEGLESTLVMLGHKLRGGVTVVRDYADDLPPSRPSPASSTRCGPTSSTTRSTRWRAPAPSGHASAPTSDGVVVEIADTGPG